MDAAFGLWDIVSSERVWLGKNATWEDVEAMPNFTKGRDLYYAIPIAVFLTILRFLLERLVFLPAAARVFRIGSKQKTPQTNAILEKTTTLTTMNKSQLEQLSQEINWSVGRIQSWIRRKRNYNKIIKKFTETSWRLTFYTCAAVYGLFTAKNLPWADMPNVFPESFQEEVVTQQIWWYYQIQLAFYVSLSVTMMFDIRRKDFFIMALHHVYTILLISISWVSNATYIGCLVMMCHDVADVPLETSKLCKYMKKESLANVTFVLFFLTWLVSRLGYYPFLVFGNLWYSGSYYSPFCYYTTSSLMVALLGLHLIWTWMIIKIVRMVMTEKQSVKDVRSDIEASSDEEIDSKKK